MITNEIAHRFLDSVLVWYFALARITFSAELRQNGDINEISHTRYISYFGKFSCVKEQALKFLQQREHIYSANLYDNFTSLYRYLLIKIVMIILSTLSLICI
jgi:hypothetical protein